MAYGGALPARQHGSHFARKRYERHVADRVHAAMKPMEVMPAHARVNRTGADSHREQLRTGHHAVLPPGEITDQPVLRHRTATRPLHRQVNNSPFDCRPEGVADLAVPCD
jgi:hypothetical protein